MIRLQVLKLVLGRTEPDGRTDGQTDRHGSRNSYLDSKFFFHLSLYSDGSYNCVCKNGFEASGEECSDVDECFENPFSCPDNSQCSNNVGGFDCICDAGYTMNNGICEEGNQRKWI